MEGELEAELEKLAEEKSDADARAILLSSQLANCQLQVGSLETKLSALTRELSSETQRRVAAETRTDEAENKMREAEGTLDVVRKRDMRKLKEELEESLERIAFVEGEAEDCRNELNAEKQRYREEIDALKTDVDTLRGKLREKRVLDSPERMDDEEKCNDTDAKKENDGNRDILVEEEGTHIDASDSMMPSTVTDATISGHEECKQKVDGDASKIALEKSSQLDASETSGSSSDEEQCKQSEETNQLDVRETVSVEAPDPVRAPDEILNVPCRSGENSPTNTCAGDSAERECSGGDELAKQENGALDAPMRSASSEGPAVVNDDREQCIRSLEAKLEAANTRLMDSETILSQTRTELEEALANKVHANGTNAVSPGTASKEKIAELESIIGHLREENAALREQSKKTPSDQCCTIC